MFFRSHLEVLNVERFFKNVRSISTHSYTSAGCQVATVATHRFHHKHSSLGARGGLLDLVTSLKSRLEMFCIHAKKENNVPQRQIYDRL